jgi:type II secretory pathway pseudopilin PulG
MHGKLKIVNRKSKIKNRSAGFTLTEVIIASALLIIAIVPILKGLTSAHVTSTTIERKTRSLTLAQAKLDDIRARSVSDWGLPTSFREMNVSLDGSYLCTVLDTPSGPNLRTIAVSVGYDVNGNSLLMPDEVEVTLSTLVAKRL